MKKYINFSLIVLVLLAIQPSNVFAATYTLTKGWNLVSADVAGQMDRNNGWDSFLQSGGSIFGLNPRDKQYYGGSGNRETLQKNLEKMYQGMSDGDDGVFSIGWWVYTPRDVNLSVNFDVPVDAQKNYQEAYHFYRGWNLVGITSVMVGKSLKDIAGSCTYEAAYAFDGSWIKFSEGAMESNFIETGKSGKLGDALAIKVSSDCAFNFPSPVSNPQLPSLPE